MRKENKLEISRLGKSQIPYYAKDVRLNIDDVLAHSSLSPGDAAGVALAAAFAAKCPELVAVFRDSDVLAAAEKQAAVTAASIVAMTSVSYTYISIGRTTPNLNPCRRKSG